MSSDDVTDTTDTKDAGSTFGNGLKVALVAGGVLGAGFLFWRLAYGGRADDDEKKTEADVQTAPTAAAVAPSASCACHGLPPAPVVDAHLLTMMEAMTHHGTPVVRVGDRWLTLPDVRSEVMRRLAA